MGTTFARCGVAIVTTLTVVGGLVVRERYSECGPHRSGVMTGIAHIAGNGMSHGFESTATDAIMTTTAGAGLPRYGAVIKRSANPGGGVMAHIASRCGRYVGGAFACGHSAVMAVFTSIGGLRMRKGHHKGQPGRIDMTGFAHIAAERMVPRFKSATTDAIVTTGTGASSAGLAMVKRRGDGQEAGGDMASFTEVSA